MNRENAGETPNSKIQSSAFSDETSFHLRTTTDLEIREKIAIEPLATMLCQKVNRNGGRNSAKANEPRFEFPSLSL